MRLQGASKRQQHKKDLETFLNCLMQDEQRMGEFMKNIHQVKLHKKAQVLRPEDRDNP
jgi:hypothetical protein